MDAARRPRRLWADLFCALGLIAFFCLLSFPEDPAGTLLKAALLAVLLVLVLRRRSPAGGTAGRPDRLVLRLGLALALGFLLCSDFLYRWASYDLYPAARFLARRLPIRLNYVLYLLIAAAVPCAAWFFLRLCRALPSALSRTPAAEEPPCRGLAAAVCAVSAFAAITLCSRSSFLYPFNDWVDANCFFTVGKGMMNGLVPYRDLLEQKGPLLYFLHGLAWLVDHDGFFGVYLLELAAAFGFLWFSYRTMALACGRRALYLAPVLALAVYTSQSLVYGDSAEELCLPLAAWAIWRGALLLRTEQPLSRRDGFLLGLTAGCVLWVKFTLVGFYLGWILVPAWWLLKTGRAPELGRLLLRIALGAAAATLPWLLYFGLHGAVGDWLRVYLYNNLFLYPINQDLSLWARVRRGLWNVNLCDTVAFALIFLALFRACLTQRLRLALHLLCMTAAAFLGVYYGGRIFAYYPFWLSLFLPFGLEIFGELLPEPAARRPRAGLAALTVVCAALCLLLTPNRDQIGEKRENLPQFQFAEIIRQEENPTLLNYGFLDGGFYTAAEVLPTCKVFCDLNLLIPEIRKLHVSYVKKGVCQFVVTRNMEIDAPIYVCVAEADYFFVQDNHYRLYRRIDNPENP